MMNQNNQERTADKVHSMDVVSSENQAGISTGMKDLLPYVMCLLGGQGQQQISFSSLLSDNTLPLTDYLKPGGSLLVQPDNANSQEQSEADETSLLQKPNSPNKTISEALNTCIDVDDDDGSRSSFSSSSTIISNVEIKSMANELVGECSESVNRSVKKYCETSVTECSKTSVTECSEKTINRCELTIKTVKEYNPSANKSIEYIEVTRKTVGKCSQLPSKSVGECSQVPSKLVGECNQLPSNSVGDCSQLPSKSVEECSQLPSKSVGECSQLPSKSVGGCKQLPSKSIEERKQLPNKSVKKYSQLPTKSVEECKQLPNKSVKKCSQLPSRSVGECKQLPSKSVEKCSELLKLDKKAGNVKSPHRVCSSEGICLWTLEKPNTKQLKPISQDCFSILKNPKKNKKNAYNDFNDHYVALDEYYFAELLVPQDHTSNSSGHKEYLYKCDCCSEFLYGNIGVVDHSLMHLEKEEKKSHKGIENFICKHCFSEWNSEEELKNHVTEVHVNMNSLSCLICSVLFPSSAKLRDHMTTTHFPFEMPYSCPACSYRSSLHKDVVNHFNKIHKHEPHVMCPYCLNMCSPNTERDQLLFTNAFFKHIKRHKDKKVKVKCSSCCLLFFDYQEMYVHTVKDHISFFNSANAVPFIPRRNSSIIVTEKIPKLNVTHPATVYVTSKIAELIQKIQPTQETKESDIQSTEKGIQQKSVGTTDVPTKKADVPTKKADVPTKKQKKRVRSKKSRWKRKKPVARWKKAEVQRKKTQAQWEKAEIHWKKAQIVLKRLDIQPETVDLEPAEKDIQPNKIGLRSREKKPLRSKRSARKTVHSYSEVDSSSEIDDINATDHKESEDIGVKTTSFETTCPSNKTVELDQESGVLNCCIDFPSHCLECGNFVEDEHFYKPLCCRCGYLTYCPHAFSFHILNRHPLLQKKKMMSLLLNQAGLQKCTFSSYSYSSTTSGMLEEPKYVCSLCKQPHTSAWLLMQHFQSHHVNSDTSYSMNSAVAEAFNKQSIVPHSSALQTPFLEQPLDRVSLFPRSFDQKLSLDVFNMSTLRNNLPSHGPPPLLESSPLNLPSTAASMAIAKRPQLDISSVMLRELVDTTNSPAGNFLPSRKKLLQTSCRSIVGKKPNVHHGNTNNSHQSSANSSSLSLPSLTAATNETQPSSPKIKSKVCEFCGKSFRCMSNLVVHRRCHTGEKPFKCKICNRGFATSGKVTRHMKTHNRKKNSKKPFHEENYVQSKSGKLVTKNYESQQDSRAIISNKQNIYPQVPQSSSTLTTSGNSSRAAKKKLLLCQFCGQGFSSTYRLSVHRISHNKEKCFKCNICNKAFPYACLLKRHMIVHSLKNISSGKRPVHLKQPHYIRGKDGKFIRSKAQVRPNSKGATGIMSRIHTNAQFSEVERYPGSSQLPQQSSTLLSVSKNSPPLAKTNLHSCELCGRAFEFKSGLMRHLQCHTGERPFRCNVCNQTFTRAYNLKAHITNTHHRTVNTSNTNPVASCQLSQSFPSSTARGSQPVSAKTDPNSCEFCGKHFKFKPSLIIHRRSHTGERPFKCPVCNWAFTSKSNLYRHMGTCKKKKKSSSKKSFHLSESYIKIAPKSSAGNIAAKDHEAQLLFKTVTNNKSKVNSIKNKHCQPSMKLNSSLQLSRSVSSAPKTKKACEFCGKRFRFMSNLAVHRMSHAEEELFKCQLCNYAFTRASKLEEHMITHNQPVRISSEKPFEMTDSSVERGCNGSRTTPERHEAKQSFTTVINDESVMQPVNKNDHQSENYPKMSFNLPPFSTSLTTSENPPSSTKTKLLSCEFCGKRFHKKYNLKVHRLTHTGTNLPECHICHRSFTQLWMVKRHMKVHMHKKRKSFQFNDSYIKDGIQNSIDWFSTTNPNPQTHSKSDRLSTSTNTIHHIQNGGETDEEEEIDVVGNINDQNQPELVNQEEIEGIVSQDLLRELLTNGASKHNRVSREKKEKKSINPAVLNEAVENSLANLQGYSETCEQTFNENSAVMCDNSTFNSTSNNGVYLQLPIVEGTQSVGGPALDLNVGILNTSDQMLDLTQIKVEDVLNDYEDSNIDFRPKISSLFTMSSDKNFYNSNDNDNRKSKAKSSSGCMSSNYIPSSGLGPNNNSSTQNSNARSKLKGKHRSRKRQHRSKTCEYCGKVCKSYSYLITHRKIHTGEKPFKCNICGHAFPTLDKLNRHTPTHGGAGEAAYFCPFCDVPFIVRQTLAKHMYKCRERSATS